MTIFGIIPARYASTRFPGKPLHLVAGKPLIQHVVEQARKAASLAEVIVAADDGRIRDAAQKFCRVEMTAPIIRAAAASRRRNSCSTPGMNSASTSRSAT